MRTLATGFVLVTAMDQLVELGTSLVAATVVYLLP
jgi:hypothetical protein